MGPIFLIPKLKVFLKAAKHCRSASMYWMESPRQIHFISFFGALTLHCCTFIFSLFILCVNNSPCTKSVDIETQNRADHVLSFSQRLSFTEDMTCSETLADLYRPHQVTVRQGRSGSSGGSAVLLPFVGVERRAYPITGYATALPLLPKSCKGKS